MLCVGLIMSYETHSALIPHTVLQLYNKQPFTQVVLCPIKNAVCIQYPSGRG